MAQLSQLPIELIVHILEYLSENERINLFLVNRLCYFITFSTVINKLRIRVQPRFLIEDGYWYFLSKITRCISFFNIQLKNLRELYLVNVYRDTLFLYDPNFDVTIYDNLEILSIKSRFDLYIYVRNIPRNLHTLTIKMSPTFDMPDESRVKFNLTGIKNDFIFANLKNISIHCKYSTNLDKFLDKCPKMQDNAVKVGIPRYVLPSRYTPDWATNEYKNFDWKETVNIENLDMRINLVLNPKFIGRIIFGKFHFRMDIYNNRFPIIPNDTEITSLYINSKINNNIRLGLVKELYLEEKFAGNIECKNICNIDYLHITANYKNIRTKSLFTLPTLKTLSTTYENLVYIREYSYSIKTIRIIDTNTSELDLSFLCNFGSFTDFKILDLSNIRIKSLSFNCCEDQKHPITRLIPDFDFGTWIILIKNWNYPESQVILSKYYNFEYLFL